MGKVNWVRVILGGLLAGVIINVFEFILNGLLLAKDMQAAISALGKQMGGGQLLMFACMGLFGWHFCGLALRRDTPTLRRGAKDRALCRLGSMVPRVSAGRRHTAGAEALPYPSHGHWPSGGAGRGQRRHTGRRLALPRTNRLGTEGIENSQ
jgi:hypothetical protein